MKKLIESKLRGSIEALQQGGTWPAFEIPAVEVAYPKGEGFGDYTSNISMVLARLVGKSPMEIAEMLKGEILKRVQDDKALEFEKIEVVRPGYLNFYLSREYFADFVSSIIREGEDFGSLDRKSEKVMAEYSQPNTHKEFHIGHLRNVFIGSAIVNTLRKAGYPTIAANYFGDTGTHIAKCLWGLVTFHADENLDGIENKAEFLGKVYSEATQKIEENPEYENEFKLLQKKFEEGDSELVALWEKTKQWSLDEFERIYSQLGVKFDAYFYESVEEEAGKSLLPELLEKGVVGKSDGAVIADLEEYGLGVLVLVRKDGSALYGLKDIPLAKKKFEEYGIDRSVYVVDVRQSLYFRQLFKILELYGFHKDMAHIGYEFVALKGGESMSSRKGNVVAARTLIESVAERVRRQFPESPDPESIAIGAIRFAMLKHSAGSKIEFDIDESVRLEGATGPYVQYAHARIASILRKAEEKGFSTEMSGVGGGWAMHEKEIELIRELAKFPDLVAEIAESYEVHRLPHYAIRLADKFHSFYNDCKVIDEENPELTVARLKLVKAVQIVLAETLRLIGVSAPERM
jgi:arginyl-tRNA synthetase